MATADISIKAPVQHHKLNEIKATAICGNDITSSCLYVSAISIMYAGQYAWITLILVATVLYFFRSIYGEVVGALPLNGGAYNALLNTTSKFMASIAACLTLLSYVATAVISASEAMHYLHHIFSSINVMSATIIVLAIFMGLTIIGIGESANVAVGIFLFHLFSLVILCLTCVYFLFTHGWDIFNMNSKNQLPYDFKMALFYGFSAAMLGISGFESSANFVEEQEHGVFPKTLRNMWVIVSFFNPLLAFLILTVIPIPDVKMYQNALLSHIGEVTAGHWLSLMISIDAVLVLSGAVLTSFVGVGGLVERMTLDRILPQTLLKKNSRGVSYKINIAFFILCCSILLVTQGQLSSLAGVYTISFLSVMGLFAVGNILLKLRRGRLPRPEYASPIALLIAIIGVCVGLYGNIYMNPEYFKVFLQYFIPALLFVFVMLNRTEILTAVLYLLRYVNMSIKKILLKSFSSINNMINDINSSEFVFFTKGDNVAILNKVMQYVNDNEDTNKIKIVNVINERNKKDPKLEVDLEVLDRCYPDIDIEFIEMEGEFGPELIDKLSKEWKIPKNFMFIGSPSDKFPYRISELGGVRLII